MNAVAKALARMNATNRALHGVSVQYARDGETIPLVAKMVQSDLEISDEAGLAITTRVIDFLVPCESLTIGGKLVEPQSGDRIQIQRAAGLEIYEVMQLGAEPAYEPADCYGIEWRIHTKRVKVQ